ncbi:MAG: CsgG/HfaB family protein [Thermodesulfobacteriota bacterium]|nr:CsgG/HfaB family protein [Thermodesulfobacteriota bacterium]
MVLIKRFVLLSVFLFISGIAFADEKIHEFEVTGEGATYQDALQNALVNGISQQYGFKMKSEEVRQTKIRELSAYVNEQSKSMGEIDINTQGRIDFKTEGFVQNYKVLNRRINSSDLYEVSVLIKIAKYKTPGISPHSRRKIAIIPFRTTKSSYNFRGGHIPSSEISGQFTQKLVTEMTQTRRFTVLDREYMEEFLREKNLILSADSPVSEQMKIGEVLGVDYLLIGTISEANQKQIPYTIQVTGETGYDYSASFIVDYRIIVMATRQIKWADNVTLSLGNDELMILVPSLRGGLIQQALLEKVAKQVVHKSMDNIYPIRIVKVQSNGNLILNQGGVTVSDSELLDVFTKGQKVIDPYTRESLGSAESWVATIKITRVTAKMSYAQVVKGQLSEIREGSICRRQAQTKQLHKVPSGRTTDVKSTSGGGVILPFD